MGVTNPILRRLVRRDNGRRHDEMQFFRQRKPPRPIDLYHKDHIVKFRACGFAYSLLIPSDADYARVYGAYDYAGEDAALAARLACDKTGKLIDIAAGAGRFLEHFQVLEFDCYAAEFNEEMQCRLGRIRPWQQHRGDFRQG